MKTLRTLAKITSVALVVCLIFALGACEFLGGSLKLESFTVDRSSVKTTYFIGEEIDFSGIRATVKYSDSDLNTELTFDDVTITYDKDITATVGQKTVKVSFEDPNLNVTQETTVIITVKEDPSAPKHDSYEVDATAVKTEYFVGDTVDLTGVKIIEKFTNGGADVEMTDVSKITYDYDADTITATVGTKTILVKYDGEDAGAITITVKKPAIISAELNIDGVTLEYLVGQTVSFDGLKAYVSYENETSAIITNFTFVTDLATLTDECGNKTVTVKIDDAISGTTVNKSFSVKVDGIVDYTVNTDAMNLEYLEGETVSFAGIVVTAVYHFGKTEAVDFNDITFVHDDNLTATVGNKTVTVKVGGVEAGSFIVKVGDIPTATVNTEGVDLSYRVGETVSVEGLTVTLKFTDGTPDATVTLSDTKLTVATVLDGLTATAGTKTITVNYQFDEYSVSAQFDITVYAIDHYEVVSDEMDKNYIVGEEINYAGVKVYAVYLDGGENVLIDSSRITYSVNGALNTVGTVESTVYVDGKSTQVNIALSVVKNSVTNIAVGGTYETVYKVDSTPDFSGITVTVTYLNGDVVTLTYKDLKIGAVDTTKMAKGKDVTIGFTDANGEDGSATIKIDIVPDKYNIVQFEKDANLSAFESDNRTDNKLNYGAAGFSGQFINGGMLYVIGDDNTFKLNPYCSILDIDYSIKSLDAFYSVVDIYVHNGTDYVLLDKTAKNSTNYTYTLGGETIVTVDTYNGHYQFSKPIDKVKISVMPDAKYYAIDGFNPVILEAKVIDAFNVYTAAELSVIDNYHGTNWGRNEESNSDWDTYNWDDFKKDYEDGRLVGVNPAGVVLHKDISITYSDVPYTMFHKYEGEIIYENANGDKDAEGNVITKNFDGYYLKDHSVIYYHSGPSDFVIEGNFFQIDAENFPLVASPSIFGDGVRDYGTDYSNAAMFMFETIDEQWVLDTDERVDTKEEVSDVTINNLALRGNAGRDGWIIKQAGNTIGKAGELVTAGGLIMLKSSNHAYTTLNNVINNCFFISYFPDYQGNLTVNNSKCYDSYQNGAFVWADSNFTINDSFINGTGGPIIIAQSPDPEDNGVYYNPIVNINNTVTETHTSGEEIWFQSVGATEAVVPGIKALGSGLNLLVNTITKQVYGTAMNASWVDANNNMNIKAALMSNADSAEEALYDVMVQGTVATDGDGINRWREFDPNTGAPKTDWAAIMVLMQTKPEVASCPFITVYGADGTAYTMYFVQQGEGGTFYDLDGKAIGTESPQTTAIIGALVAADEVVLHQGGLSVLFELYH